MHFSINIRQMLPKVTFLLYFTFGYNLWRCTINNYTWTMPQNIEFHIQKLYGSQNDPVLSFLLYLGNLSLVKLRICPKPQISKLYILNLCSAFLGPSLQLFTLRYFFCFLSLRMGEIYYGRYPIQALFRRDLRISLHSVSCEIFI